MPEPITQDTIPPPTGPMPGTFIVLTLDDSNQVRMLTKPGHACAPVPLKDGTLILPRELLDDPEHLEHRDFLATLPQRSDVTFEELADGAVYPDEVKACTYDESWPVGEPVVITLPARME